MTNTSSAVYASLLIVISAITGIAGEDPGAYLMEQGGQKMLKETLTLREEQEGFAGRTGTMWVIEPSGRWRVATFRPAKQGTEQVTERQSGQLTQEQVQALAQALAAQDLASLPEKVGRESKVNPHRYTIAFGGKQSTLVGVPPRRNQGLKENIMKGAASEVAPESDIWARFAQLTHVIEGCCTSPATK